MTVSLIFLALVVLYLIFLYNRLVVARQRTKESWSDIETQLKRRYDLIPNLVETAKGYAKHESGTFKNVVEARNAAMKASGHGEEKAKAENALSSTLKSIFALSEAYPDLKANTTFLELQQEISDTEDKIQASRRFYNSTVLDLNTKIEVFPSAVIANLFQFKPEAFFEVDASEKEAVQNAPKISF